MTDSADLIVTNAEIHTLTDPDETHEALAVRDGKIVRIGRQYEIGFLEGIDTTVIDLDGDVLLPGFIDAHTHMEQLGCRLVHADLSAADSIEEAVALLCEERERTATGWVLGYGYDESAWNEDRLLCRDDLDRVSEERPVVAFREDLHTGSLNSVALERYGSDMPVDDVRRSGGEPTGVVVEDALSVVRRDTAPGRERMHDLITAARDCAHELGVTGVHDMVRWSAAPRVYRELDRADQLELRVRINYWSDHLDALDELGTVTNHGSEFVRVGGVKSYTDGSFGGRTAQLAEPYENGATGQWVTGPEQLREIVTRANEGDHQCCVHAIGDRAVETVLDSYEATDDPSGSRHRIEHAELLSEPLLEQFAEMGVVASVQPNFLKWAREDGLYEDRIGRERTRRTNQYRALLDAGVPLAFGSDCMPLDPLFGVEQTVTAPAEQQRLTITEALRAYTAGAAYAGFDEHRLGTIEPGNCADLVALDRSPWEIAPDAIADIAVTHTIVDGRVVYS
ncbi:amidohydrolase [Halocatena salina]|uniref:Amidohydrolase n=1 Tax=Halocatena salina TaxID=2934340 RepID=A0A8U0A0I7_9EURY|nr:amidohydrolase [Halocatena salina]UPM41938.1 amidohydrolase [Halocatena salina]